MRDNRTAHDGAAKVCKVVVNALLHTATPGLAAASQVDDSVHSLQIVGKLIVLACWKEPKGLDKLIWSLDSTHLGVLLQHAANIVTANPLAAAKKRRRSVTALHQNFLHLPQRWLCLRIKEGHSTTVNGMGLWQAAVFSSRLPCLPGSSAQ